MWQVLCLVALFGMCTDAMAGPLMAAIPALTAMSGSTLALTAAGAVGAKALMNKMKSKAPAVQSPAVMPTPNDEAVKAARQREIAAMQSRSGRASTVLSQDDKMGG